MAKFTIFSNKLRGKFTIKTAMIIVAFIIGFMFCSQITNKDVSEGMFVLENFEGADKPSSGDPLDAPPPSDLIDEQGNPIELTSKKGFNPKKDCPNVLIRDGKKLYLYNNRRAKVPGVNPMTFDNLEEYVEYMVWLRKQGRNCPVLYLRKVVDAQGKLKLRMGQDPLEDNAGLDHLPPMKGVLDASQLNEMYNTNMNQGFDADNQSIGIYTPLDKMFNSKKRKSANPMDSNWGGKDYSEDIVDMINEQREEDLENEQSFVIKRNPDPTFSPGKPGAKSSNKHTRNLKSKMGLSDRATGSSFTGTAQKTIGERDKARQKEKWDGNKWLNKPSESNSHSNSYTQHLKYSTVSSSDADEPVNYRLSNF